MGTCPDRTTLAGTPKLELADIFSAYSHLLGSLSGAEAKVVHSIIDCRTSALGGHVRRCDGCGEEEISYNSCRNRHCPKCQFIARAKWVQARTAELLPISYFHVVFTLPHVLNSLVFYNKRLLYELLFQSASETLKEVGARRLQDAQMGFTAVLHTWGQNLMDHPHLHLIVPGGGLSKDGTKWIHTPSDYLLPLRILSEVYRGKFLSRLERMHSELEFPQSIAEFKDKGRFKHLLRKSAEKSWVVYAKKPFAGPKQVLNYLGNYTHRVAISNFRLIKLEHDHVHFRYRDYKTGETKIKVLHAKEFMRRFLLHVLPRKFVRMRHFGFLGSRFKKCRLAQANTVINPASTARKSIARQPEEENWKQWLKKTTGIDLEVCRHCQARAMREVRTLMPRLSIRQPESRSLDPTVPKGWDSS